jgi:hypothetical protein
MLWEACGLEKAPEERRRIAGTHAFMVALSLAHPLWSKISDRTKYKIARPDYCDSPSQIPLSLQFLYPGIP